VALDVYTAAYISGTTLSTNFPVTAGVFQKQCGTDAACNGGLSDAFAVKVSTSADLAILAIAPKTVASGSTLTYTISSGNNGPDVASQVVITDVLPTGTTFESVTVNTGSCTAPAQGSIGTVACTVGSQPKGARIKVTLVVNVTALSGSVITHTVSVAAATPDSNNKNNSTTLSTTVN
jgi:uncharacterized repeat protein (TIGR01451 family)